MDKSHEKAQETRRKNEEVRRQLWQEQREAIRISKKALLRVMESTDATPEQILRAAELLAELGNR